VIQPEETGGIEASTRHLEACEGELTVISESRSLVMRPDRLSA
jgi:hypothetical protein